MGKTYRRQRNRWDDDSFDYSNKKKRETERRKMKKIKHSNRNKNFGPMNGEEFDDDDWNQNWDD